MGAAKITIVLLSELPAIVRGNTESGRNVIYAGWWGQRHKIRTVLPQIGTVGGFCYGDVQGSVKVQGRCKGVGVL